MKRTVSYNTAIKLISVCIDSNTIGDAFVGSTILAVLFDLDKEKTLSDLISYRVGKNNES